MIGKGALEEDGRESERRDGDHGRALERLTAYFDDGGCHDRHHGRLQSVEQGRNDQQISKGCIDVTEEEEDKNGGKNEQAPCNRTSSHPVQQPADVGRQLLRLRAGQNHAVVQGIEKPLIAHPFPLLHQFMVHDGNLSGRAAEVDETKLEPELERLGKGRMGCPVMIVWFLRVSDYSSIGFLAHSDTCRLRG